MRSAKIVVLGAVAALLLVGCSGTSSEGSADTTTSTKTGSADSAAQDVDTGAGTEAAGDTDAATGADTGSADDTSPETDDTTEDTGEAVQNTRQFDTSGITGWTGDELCAALMAADPATMRGEPVSEANVHELGKSAVRCEAGDGGDTTVVLYVKWPNGSGEPESNDAAQIYSNVVGSQCRTALPLGEQACYVSGLPVSVNMTVGGIYAGLTVNPANNANQQAVVDGFVRILDKLGIPH